MQEELLSIGELAEACGISVDTIRAWERRYGRPQARRLPSGHRRYLPRQVIWLRRVAEALARRHRPSKVVPLDEEKLLRLLDGAGREDGGSDPLIERLIESVRRGEGEELRRSLVQGLAERGPRELIASVIAPLLTSIGRSWADGKLDVWHEHFAAQIIEEFLRGARRGLEASQDGACLIFTTLTGEAHGLGLQMAATHASLAGARPVVLGPETPEPDIVAAAAEHDAYAVALSVSLASGGVATDRRIAGLRKVLPEPVRLFVGGRGARGARRGPRGVIYCPDLAPFESALAGSDTPGRGKCTGRMGASAVHGPPARPRA